MKLVAAAIAIALIAAGCGSSAEPEIYASAQTAVPGETTTTTSVVVPAEKTDEPVATDETADPADTVPSTDTTIPADTVDITSDGSLAEQIALVELCAAGYAGLAEQAAIQETLRRIFVAELLLTYEIGDHNSERVELLPGIFEDIFQTDQAYEDLLAFMRSNGCTYVDNYSSADLSPFLEFCDGTLFKELEPCR